MCESEATLVTTTVRPLAVPAARSLRALFDRHGLHDLADALERWLDGHAAYEVAR